MADPATHRRVAVLISGRGSNLRALIDHCASPQASASVALVASNDPDALGLDHARAAGIAHEVLSQSRRDDFERSLSILLQDHAIEIICLGGFMRVLSPALVEAWRDRLLNIHPSLLPAFRGLDTHRRALEAGVRFHGCTVHFVRAEVDAGPIIIQGAVPVHQDDTPQNLAARVLTLEHRCYPQALELVASGRVRVVNERVTVEGTTMTDAVLINPVWDGPAQL